MSEQQQTIHKYASSFATGDLAAILSCVSDDLVWELNGEQAGNGKAAFEAQMIKDLASGTAEVNIERLVQQDDVVVALNRGRFIPSGDDEAIPFVSAEVYTFAGSKIHHIQTFQNLG